jgi:hypothetical protein
MKGGLNTPEFNDKPVVLNDEPDALPVLPDKPVVLNDEPDVLNDEPDALPVLPVLPDKPNDKPNDEPNIIPNPVLNVSEQESPKPNTDEKIEIPKTIEDLDPNQITIKFFKTEIQKTIVANIGNILNSVGLFEALITKFNETNKEETNQIVDFLTINKLSKDLLIAFYKTLANAFEITDLKVNQLNLDNAAKTLLQANMASYLLATMFFAGLAGGSKQNQKSVNNFTLKGKMHSRNGKTNKNRGKKMKGGELSEKEIEQIPLLAINIIKDIIQQIYLNIELLKHLKDVNQTTIDDLINIMTLNQDLYVSICNTLPNNNCEEPTVFNKTLVSIFIPSSESKSIANPINQISMIG